MTERVEVAESQHYVQQAYQKGFYDVGKTNYWVFDKRLLIKSDGTIEKNDLKERGSRVTFEEDYFYESSFYEGKDFLEKRFFGPIDSEGIEALRYMSSPDKHILPHAEIGIILLKYISAQKFRTPKGIELLAKSQPKMSREALLEILQEVHKDMVITLGESIVEILDASSCDTKFIVSDAPVIEWNPLTSEVYADLYLLKGTQVIFPVNKDTCLIFTPRELGEGRLSKKQYLEPRINARKEGRLIFDIRKLQNLRTIENSDVGVINKLIKERALRYVVGGKKEFLFPSGNLSHMGILIAPKSPKITGGIATRIKGKVEGIDEYGRKLEGKSLEDMQKFFDWIEKKKNL